MNAFNANNVNLKLKTACGKWHNAAHELRSNFEMFTTVASFMAWLVILGNDGYAIDAEWWNHDLTGGSNGRHNYKYQGHWNPGQGREYKPYLPAMGHFTTPEHMDNCAPCTTLMFDLYKESVGN